MKALFLSFALLVSLVARAELVVKVDAPKTTGSKTVIKLTMKNTFAEKIQSARATVFLHDSDGKVVEEATQWVIGGTKEKPGLATDTSTTFNYVITTDKPFAKAKVIFNRVVLDAGELPFTSFGHSGCLVAALAYAAGDTSRLSINHCSEAKDPSCSHMRHRPVALPLTNDCSHSSTPFSAA
jgi:hypothetical protein